MLRMSASALSCPTAYGAPWTSAGPAPPRPYGRLSALRRCRLLCASMHKSRCRAGGVVLTALSERGTGKGKQSCQQSGSRKGVHKRARRAGGTRGGAGARSPVPTGPRRRSGCNGLFRACCRRCAMRRRPASRGCRMVVSLAALHCLILPAARPALCLGPVL
jgi:hypothetical protein